MMMAVKNYQKPEGVLTFDDVNLYTKCEYKGERGWIMDKGDHLIPEVDSRHLNIEFEADIESAMVHERLVNRRLAEGRELWVDFDHKLTPGLTKE